MAQMFHDRRASDRELANLDNIMTTTEDNEIKELAQALVDIGRSMNEFISEFSDHIKADETEKIQREAVEKYRSTQESKYRSVVNTVMGTILGALVVFIGFSFVQYVQIKSSIDVFNAKFDMMEKTTSSYRQRSDKTMDKIDRATE